MINCQLCNNEHKRKSKFCSNKCRNRYWYINNQEYIKKYRNNNKNEQKESHKVWRSSNIEHTTQYEHNYYLDNKNKHLDYQKQYSRARKQQDINFKLRCNIRSRLSACINGNLNSGSAIKDLGCTISELKIYLESKWQDGMNWDNYGLKGWHIDHIKPISGFVLTNREELKQACHYTNLQPLWAKDNLKKGNR